MVAATGRHKSCVAYRRYRGKMLLQSSHAPCICRASKIVISLDVIYMRLDGFKINDTKYLFWLCAGSSNVYCICG